jgi:hypothetical protein
MTAAPQSDFGPKPALVWLAIDKLAVDAKYQRDTSSRRSQQLIEKISASFLWARFGVVLTVKNKEGWFVIDGQHRVEAARRCGIPSIPCVVLPHATVAAAAADFVAINRDRVAVTPLHIHHAQLAAGDPVAQAIERVCRSAKVEICRYPVPSDKMKPGQTLAVQTIARLIKIRDEAFATAVLQRVRNGKKGDLPGAMSALAIRTEAEVLGIESTRRPSAVQSTTKRNCLKCARRFDSEGPGNRMCVSCRGAA